MNDEYRKRYNDLKTLEDYEKVFRDIVDDYIDDDGMDDYHLKLQWTDEKTFVVECTSKDGFDYHWKQQLDWSIDRMFNNFTYKLVKAMITKDQVQDWTLKQEFKDIIRSYIHDLPQGKCLVMTLEGGRGAHRTYFLHFNTRWPRFDSRLYYFNGWDYTGSGPDWEFNVPIFSRTVDLEDRWEARYINGRWIPGKHTCLVGWQEYPDEPENKFGHWYIRDTLPLNSEDDDGFYTFGDITDVKIVDMPDPDMYMDHFAEEYLKQMHPEMYEDLPDDPKIDEELKMCESYNPDAFDFWKDKFCRKYCFIDKGTGCGSNCCKVGIINFVDAQYSQYKIPSVDGQPNRFSGEDE